jgi:hypothetical protein
MSKETTSSGVGFGGLLTIVFIVLKLTHYINWSWWWVLSPALLPMTFILIFLLVVGILFLIERWLN